jgi:hypothetical protein
MDPVQPDPERPAKAATFQSLKVILGKTRRGGYLFLPRKNSRSGAPSNPKAARIRFCR